MGHCYCDRHECEHVSWCYKIFNVLRIRFYEQYDYVFTIIKYLPQRFLYCNFCVCECWRRTEASGLWTRHANVLRKIPLFGAAAHVRVSCEHWSTTINGIRNELNLYIVIVHYVTYLHRARVVGGREGLINEDLDYNFQ